MSKPTYKETEYWAWATYGDTPYKDPSGSKITRSKIPLIERPPGQRYPWTKIPWSKKPLTEIPLGQRYLCLNIPWTNKYPPQIISMKTKIYLRVSMFRVSLSSVSLSRVALSRVSLFQGYLCHSNQNNMSHLTPNTMSQLQLTCLDCWICWRILNWDLKRACFLFTLVCSIWIISGKTCFTRDNSDLTHKGKKRKQALF